MVRKSKEGQAGFTTENAFVQASNYWDRGQLTKAFDIFLRLADQGDASSQVNVGYFFDRGLGVRRDQAKALLWYRRAYRHGHASGAHNIGTLYRDRGNFAVAAKWFSRALHSGNDGSALELAKIHLRGRNPKSAVTFLRRVAGSSHVTGAEQEEAVKLLGDLGRAQDRRTSVSRRRNTGGLN
jgi:TPR repeat protein